MNSHLHRVLDVLLVEVRGLEAIREPDAEIAAVVASLRAASSDIMTREATRVEAARKIARLRELQPLCRAARDKAAKLDREFLASEKAIVRAQDGADNAERHWIDARNAKPRPEHYPTQSELENHRTIVAACEAALEEARSKFRDAKSNHERIRREGLAAREEFQRLAFEERQCQPPDKSQPREFRVMSIG